MELLRALETKVISLIEVGRRLQTENLALHEECRRLGNQVEILERSLLANGQRADDIESAKLLVDELIRNIDLVVERELAHSQEKLETPS